MIRHKLFTIICVCILFLSIATSVEAGNDFITVNLRIDIPEVRNSLDYQVWLASSVGPMGSSPNFTSAWISVNLDNQPGQYGQQFSQVGIMAEASGLHWFVYAEPGVECYRGHPTWWIPNLNKYLGCWGDPGDLVDWDYLIRSELVTYHAGYWIARIEDYQGNTYDVARILSNSTTIYNTDVNMEEGYGVTQDPYDSGIFYMYHPQYNSWIDGFREWPVSIGNTNNPLYVIPNSICPDHYAAHINLYDDPRYWEAGLISNGICSAMMFPGVNTYIPYVANQ